MYSPNKVIIHVDACVLPTNSAVGIGIICRQYPSMNAGESVSKSLEYDINQAELYAIIRGMEKAHEYGLSNIRIVSDSAAALKVALTREDYWPSHYEELKARFLNAKGRLNNNVEFVQLSAGDTPHRDADNLAKKGALNW